MLIIKLQGEWDAMKKINKVRLFSALGVLPLLAMFLYPATSSAEEVGKNPPCTPPTFAVLAGTTITNTGATVINGTAGGDIGLFPGSSFTGKTEVTKSGVIHIGDEEAKKAKTDLVKAFDDISAPTPVVRASSELGSQTITPGTYSSGDGKFENSGKLILDAKGDSNAKFIFQTASTLITAPGSTITLINGAQACNVYWKVGSSATLGDNSTFVGKLIALTTITANSGANIQGQLLAENGAVNLNANTINNAASVTPLPTVTPTPLPTPAMATLHIIEDVVNNPGGTAVAGDFIIHVKVHGVDVAGSPAVGLGAPGRTYTLPAGNYTVTQEPVAGFIGNFSGQGITNGFVSLAPSSDVTITRTNTDVTAPVAVPTPTPSATPVVTPAPAPAPNPSAKPRTVTGGKLPKTGSPWYNLLALGAGLMLLGGLGIRSRKVLR
jgi:LPXTG-motif cell wall-anchored protein